MMDLTFLIPIRIETEDRLRNVISSVSYLLKHIPAKIIVKEVSSNPIFEIRALPEIKKYANTDNLTFLYEKDDDPFFCKSKVLNDLLVKSDTKVVANYDADCILPITSYHQAYSAIKNDQVDVVYPYGCGVYQWRSEYNVEVYNEFVEKLNVSVLDKRKILYNSTIGWVQFVNRKKYIQSYMMNENFISWGCEDSEFYYRMSFLGNRIARIDDYVYHLEHSRTFNSWFSNPNFNSNNNLWNTIKTFNIDQLVNYYERQDYFKNHKEQLS
jgi:predicted glycosyltransferase involved in capsule biosynthesis